jgi:hypothetical protein
MSKNERIEILLELYSAIGDIKDIIKGMKMLSDYITPDNVGIHENIHESMKKLMKSIKLLSDTIYSMN